jgi:porphobilinogen deaminase
MQYVPLRLKYKVGTRESQLALIQTERYVLLSILTNHINFSFLVLSHNFVHSIQILNMK